MNRKPRMVTLTILGLALAAGAVLALEAARVPGPDHAQAFQELAGGLGFGPAQDIGRCEAALDPRLCEHCSSDVGLIPGGMVFCPHHGTARGSP